MPSAIDKLLTVFVRPRAHESPGASTEAWPHNVVPLRRQADSTAVATATHRSVGGREAVSGLSPRLVIVGLAGSPPPAITGLIADAVRRRDGATVAFVVDPALDISGKPGQARLKLGAGAVVLPFRTKRQAAGVLRIGALAAERHDLFLRSLGPLVWAVSGTELDREQLCTSIAGRDGVVLLRPSAVDCEYSRLVAAQIRDDGLGVAVSRARIGSAGDPLAQHETDADGEIAIPYGAGDRWRNRFGIGTSRAALDAAEQILGELL